MNKFIYMVMSLLLVAAVMTGCGNYNAGKPSNTPNVEGSPVVTTQPKKETTTPTETATKDEYGKFQLPRLEMYCNVPSETGSSTNKRVGVVTGYDAYIGTVFCGGTGEYTGNLEGILAFAADDFAADTAKFLLADLDPAELKASNTEKVTVSGYDAVKFSGPVKNKSGNTYEIYGYSMFIEDRPVMFVGILCSDEQAQADLDDMKDLIDLMASTIYK